MKNALKYYKYDQFNLELTNLYWKNGKISRKKLKKIINKYTKMKFDYEHNTTQQKTTHKTATLIEV